MNQLFAKRNFTNVLIVIKRHQPGGNDGNVSCHGQMRCANAPMRPGRLFLLCQDGAATVGCRKGSMGSMDFEAPGGCDECLCYFQSSRSITG